MRRIVGRKIKSLRWLFTALVIVLSIVSCSGGSSTDENGEPRATTFSKSYGGQFADEANGVTSLSDGGYAFVGTSDRGSILESSRCADDFGGACADDVIWLTRLDGEGEIVWSHSYSSAALNELKRFGIAGVGDGTRWDYGSNGVYPYAARINAATNSTEVEFFVEPDQPFSNCLSDTKPQGAIVTAAAGSDGSLYFLAKNIGLYDETGSASKCKPKYHTTTYLYKYGPDGNFIWRKLMSSLRTPFSEDYDAGTRYFSGVARHVKEEWRGTQDRIIVANEKIFVFHDIRSATLRWTSYNIEAMTTDGVGLWSKEYFNVYESLSATTVIDSDNDGDTDLLIIAGTEREVLYDAADGGITALDMVSGQQVWQQTMSEWGSVSVLISSCAFPDLPCVIIAEGPPVKYQFTFDGYNSMGLFDAASGQLLRKRTFAVNDFMFVGPISIRLLPDPAQGFEVLYGDRKWVNGSPYLITWAQYDLEFNLIKQQTIPQTGVPGPKIPDEKGGFQIAEASDGGLFVLGELADDPEFWLLKTDSAGNPQWQKRFGADAGKFPRMEVSGDRVFVATFFPNRYTDVYALSETGELLWAKEIYTIRANNGISSIPSAVGLAAFSDGGSVLSSRFNMMRFDASGETLYSYSVFPPDGGASRINFEDAAAREDITWVLASRRQQIEHEWGHGRRANSPTSLNRFILYRLNSRSGAVVSAFNITFPSYGPMADVESADIAVAADGSVWFTGTIVNIDGDASDESGDSNVFAMRIEADGRLLASRLYGGLAPDRATASHVTADGGVIISGASDSLGDYSEAWILRLGPGGEIEAPLYQCNANIALQDHELPVISPFNEASTFLHSVNLSEVEIRDLTDNSYLHPEPVLLTRHDLDSITEARQCRAVAQSVPAPSDPVLTIRVLGAGEDDLGFQLFPSPGASCHNGVCQTTVASGSTFALQIAPEHEGDLRAVEGCDSQFAFGRCQLTVEGDRELLIVYDSEPAADDDAYEEWIRDARLEIAGTGRLAIAGQDIVCEGSNSYCIETLVDPFNAWVDATPAPDFTFGGWELCTGEVSGNRCKLSYAAPFARARFAQASIEPLREITLALSGPGELVLSSDLGPFSCRGIDRTCTTQVPLAADFSITAYPQSGYVFAGWDACPGTADGARCDIAAGDSEVTVRAAFEPPPPITRTATFELIGAGELVLENAFYSCDGRDTSCSTAILRAQSYNVQAVATQGTIFSRWAVCPGDINGTSCSIPAGEQDVDIQAVFDDLPPPPSDERRVTFQIRGQGEINIAGVPYCTGTNINCSSTLSTSQSYSFQPLGNFSSLFVEWEACPGTVDGPLCEIAPGNNDLVIRARFTAIDLNVIAGDFGRVQVRDSASVNLCTADPSCIVNDVSIDQTYELTSLPDAGYQFVGWGPGVCSRFDVDDNPLRLRIRADLVDPIASGRIECRARFAASTGMRNASLTVEGRGEVTLSNGFSCAGTDVDCQTSLSTAQAYVAEAGTVAGWEFYQWTQCPGDRNLNLCTIPEGQEPVEVHAQFVPETPAGTRDLYIRLEGRGDVLIRNTAITCTGSNSLCIREIAEDQSYIAEARDNGSSRFLYWSVCPGDFNGRLCEIPAGDTNIAINARYE